jgi:hypothetical protein
VRASKRHRRDSGSRHNRRRTSAPPDSRHRAPASDRIPRQRWCRTCLTAAQRALRTSRRGRPRSLRACCRPFHCVCRICRYRPTAADSCSARIGLDGALAVMLRVFRNLSRTGWRACCLQSKVTKPQSADGACSQTSFQCRASGSRGCCSHVTPWRPRSPRARSRCGT